MNSDSPGGRNGKASVPGASSFKRTLSRPGICWRFALHVVFPILLVSHKIQKNRPCAFSKRKEKKKEIFYPHAADSEEEFFLEGNYVEQLVWIPRDLFALPVIIN